MKSAELSGSGPSGDFYIRSIKIWGAPYASNLNNVVIKFILNNLLVAASGNADPVIVRDYGSGARRPGVRCSIPAECQAFSLIFFRPRHADQIHTPTPALAHAYQRVCTRLPARPRDLDRGRGKKIPTKFYIITPPNFAT